MGRVRRPSQRVDALLGWGENFHAGPPRRAQLHRLSTSDGGPVFPARRDGAENLRELRPPGQSNHATKSFDITEPQLCYAWPAWRDPSDPQVATHRQGELLADNPPRQPPLVRARAHSATRWDSSPTQLYPGTIRQLQKEMLAPYRDITRPPLTFL